MMIVSFISHLTALRDGYGKRIANIDCISNNTLKILKTPCDRKNAST